MAKWRALILTACFVAVSAGSVRAQEVKIDEPTKKATAKALEWLKAKQDPEGSWTEGGYPKNNAITAFALLALSYCKKK